MFDALVCARHGEHYKQEQMIVISDDASQAQVFCHRSS
jgi:hypothetical protein